MKIEVEADVIEKLLYLISELTVAYDNHIDICNKLAKDLGVLERVLNFKAELEYQLKEQNNEVTN